MKGKIILIVVLAVSSILFDGALGEESSTENVTVFDDESSTSTSSPLIKRGRSLPVEENSIKSEGKRNPKFGFNIPLPNIPGMDGITNSTPNPNTESQVFGGGFGEGTATLGTTALLIKGGLLSGLMALKAAILPPLFLGALILFLFAGAGFFTCSIINCQRLVGDLAGGGLGGPSFGPGFGGLPPYNPFTRNGFDEYEQQRPVFQGIDEGYKKY